MIEGLNSIDRFAKDSFALVLKVHHAALDGRAFLAIMKVLHSLTRNGELPDAQHGEIETEPSSMDLLIRSGKQAVHAPLRNARILSKALPGLSEVVLPGLMGKTTPKTSPQSTPPETRFNTSVSPHRSWGACFFPLEDSKIIREAVEGATVHDIAVCVFGGAIRTYLGEIGELPRDPLKTGIVIDVRSEEDRQNIGNQLSGMITNLATDDADKLRFDPAFRVASSSLRGDKPLSDDNVLASQPTLSRLLEQLSRDENRQVIHEAIVELASRRYKSLNKGRRKKTLMIDVDGLHIEVHGHQEGSDYNGYYKQRMYHALVASAAETGDMLDGLLRPGNVSSADGALGFILDVTQRCQQSLCQSAIVRIDAGFPSGELLSGLDQQSIHYVARIRHNAALDRIAEPFLVRPPGRKPNKPRTWCYDLSYQAGSWDTARRAVSIVQERPDDLFLHHFWLITNLSEQRYSSGRLLALYRKRGKAEAHMGELMDVFSPSLSSTARTRRASQADRSDAANLTATGVRAQNQTLFLLNMLAYEVLHVGRSLMEKVSHKGWSLRRFQENVLRTAARVVHHSRQLTFVISNTARAHWARLWRIIERLPWCVT